MFCVHCCSRHEVKHLHSVFHCVGTLLTNGALYLSGKRGECSWKSGVPNTTTEWCEVGKIATRAGPYWDGSTLISHKSYNICLVRYILLKALWSYCSRRDGKSEKQNFGICYIFCKIYKHNLLIVETRVLYP